MKPFIVSLIVSFALTVGVKTARSEETSMKYNIRCFNTKEVFSTLMQQYKELPMLIGDTKTKSSDGESPVMVFFWNSSTLSYTIIHMYENKGVSCVMSEGNAEPYTPPSNNKPNTKKNQRSM